MKGPFRDDPIGEQMGQATLAEAASAQEEYQLIDCTPYLEDRDDD
jgi:hypothetical protein